MSAFVSAGYNKDHNVDEINHFSGSLFAQPGDRRDTDIEPSARIILYGSRARGDAAADSDWDLLVLVGGEVTSRREAALLHQLFEIEIETGSVLSASLRSNQDWG